MKHDASFFINPIHQWQRRYEAIRASFVDRLPAKIVAEKFGFTQTYIRLLRHQFKNGLIDFSEPVPEGKCKRRKVEAKTREQIKEWRRKNLTSGEITQLLSEEGIELSIRTVERVLAEEGFKKLPRRTKIKIGLTVKGTQIPERSENIDIEDIEGQTFESEAAGIFTFMPFIEKLDIASIVQKVHLPGTKTITPLNYFLSFLAFKLMGGERYAHMGQFGFDRGMGLFAGLNVTPKCTAMSNYSYSLDQVHIKRLQEEFTKQTTSKLHLSEGKMMNLDFHTVPHFGQESQLQEHWVGTRNRRMKGVLTLFAQDAESKLLLYTDADIMRNEAPGCIMDFFSFWKKIRRGLLPTFVFDSRFTNYANLSKLNALGIKFITLRRRGSESVKKVNQIQPSKWDKIFIAHEKRKFKHPLVYDHTVKLQAYKENVRQVIVRDNGRKNPAFLITNDFDSPVELLVSNYSRRWRVENGIAEAVKFFHLNSLSSPILTKVHFDVALTMIADTLYHMLAQNLRGFEQCDAPSLFRNFIKGKATIAVRKGEVIVTYPKRAHNPLLRAAGWNNLPSSITPFPNAKLTLKFS